MTRRRGSRYRVFAKVEQLLFKVDTSVELEIIPFAA